MSDAFEHLPLPASGLQPSPEFVRSLRLQIQTGLTDTLGQSSPGSTEPADAAHAPIADGTDGDTPHRSQLAPEPIPRRAGRRRVAVVLAAALLLAVGGSGILLLREPDTADVETGPRPVQGTTVPTDTTVPTETTVPTATTDTLPAASTSTTTLALAPPLVPLSVVRPASSFRPLESAPPFEFGCATDAADATVVATASARDAATVIAAERIHQWVLTLPSAAAAEDYVAARRTAATCAVGSIQLPGNQTISEASYETVWSADDGVALRISGNPYGSGQAAAFGNLRSAVATVQLVAVGNHVWMLLNDEAVGGGGPPSVDFAALAEAAREQLRTLA